MKKATQLQAALQKTYDRQYFVEEVLKPIFGDSLKHFVVPSAPDELLTTTEQRVLKSVLLYASIELNDGTSVACYEVELQPAVRLEQNRVAIQQYIRKLMVTGQMALINFVAPHNPKLWRLTLAAKDSILTAEGIKEKATHPKRYTYLLGPSESCRTAAERFEWLSSQPALTFDCLIEAFSVEKLSEAFFNEYKEHYQNFVEYLTGKRLVKKGGKWVEKQTTRPAPFLQSVFNGDEKKARDFVKKLLGRIVFLYFLQKKGWLGASDTHYRDGMPDFIMQLFRQSGGGNIFYSVSLTKLFFQVLNQERPNDDFEMPGGAVVKVPFLNGGLFDKEPYDDAPLVLPDHLFHHPDHEGTPLTATNQGRARGFLDFLNAYNFTIYEDSPDDHTVAVDPEMLGHIFENLLEDNKDKGAFYTPKEIVHYMCRESLIEYLVAKLGEEYTVYRSLDNGQVELYGKQTRTTQLPVPEKAGEKAIDRTHVEAIVREKHAGKLTAGQLKRIDELLDGVKICDPAIGSGAFPMGLLQEIFAIKEAIAHELNLPFEPARVKENIIQNSIYGVDIEKGAVDIARLRFWLSLVVDEEKPRPLPNLDYKIVVGDSLLSKFEGEIIEIDWEIKEGTQGNLFGNENLLKRQELLKKISEKQRKYFHATDKKKLAAEIRNLKIDILINQLELMIKTKGLDTKPTESGKKPRKKWSFGCKPKHGIRPLTNCNASKKTHNYPLIISIGNWIFLKC